MNTSPANRGLPIWLAILALAAASLACLTGDDQFDSIAFPYDFEDELDWRWSHQTGDIPDWYSKKRLQEEAEAKKRYQQPPQPQGEFVAPVAPVAPQGQSVAPQAQPPEAASISGAPVITAIDFPNTIPADGVTYYGWVSFTDTGGDVNRLRMHVVLSTTPMSDWEAQPKTLEGTTSAGKYRIGFYCTIPSLHTMQVTLVDAAGNASNSMDFSWECR